MLSTGKISYCILTDINPKFWSRPTRQKPILTGLLTSHKNLQKQNNENFFIQLFYTWLYLTYNNIPPPYL